MKRPQNGDETTLNEFQTQNYTIGIPLAQWTLSVVSMLELRVFSHGGQLSFGGLYCKLELVLSFSLSHRRKCLFLVTSLLHISQWLLLWIFVQKVIGKHFNFKFVCLFLGVYIASQNFSFLSVSSQKVSIFSNFLATYITMAAFVNFCPKK